MTMEESKGGRASLLGFAQCREKQNKAVKKENKSKRKGERGLNGLCCSINYDRVKEREAGGTLLVRVVGKTRGPSLLLNEDPFVECP